MGLTAGASPVRPLSSALRQSCILAPRLEITLFHFGRLISADEILRCHPSYVPKMPVCPLMAFYIGHINLRLSPPQGTALILAPIHPPSVHDLQLVNELQEGSGRSARRSQVDESTCLWSRWKGQALPGFQFPQGGDQTLIMYLVSSRRLWPSGPILGCNYIIYYCLFTTIV